MLINEQLEFDARHHTVGEEVREIPRVPLWMSTVAFAYGGSQKVHLQYLQSWSVDSKLQIVLVLLTVNIKEMFTQEVWNQNDRIYVVLILWLHTIRINCFNVILIIVFCKYNVGHFI